MQGKVPPRGFAAKENSVFFACVPQKPGIRFLLRALDYNKASPKLARIGTLREEASRDEPAQTGKAAEPP